MKFKTQKQAKRFMKAIFDLLPSKVRKEFLFEFSMTPTDLAEFSVTPCKRGVKFGETQRIQFDEICNRFKNELNSWCMNNISGALTINDAREKLQMPEELIWNGCIFGYFSQKVLNNWRYLIRYSTQTDEHKNCSNGYQVSISYNNCIDNHNMYDVYEEWFIESKLPFSVIFDTIKSPIENNINEAKQKCQQHFDIVKKLIMLSNETMPPFTESTKQIVDELFVECNEFNDILKDVETKKDVQITFRPIPLNRVTTFTYFDIYIFIDNKVYAKCNMSLNSELKIKCSPFCKMLDSGEYVTLNADKAGEVHETYIPLNADKIERSINENTEEYGEWESMKHSWYMKTQHEEYRIKLNNSGDRFITYNRWRDNRLHDFATLNEAKRYCKSCYDISNDIDANTDLVEIINKYFNDCENFKSFITNVYLNDKSVIDRWSFNMDPYAKKVIFVLSLYKQNKKVARFEFELTKELVFIENNTVTEKYLDFEHINVNDKIYNIEDYKLLWEDDMDVSISHIPNWNNYKITQYENGFDKYNIHIHPTKHGWNSDIKFNPIIQGTLEQAKKFCLEHFIRLYYFKDMWGIYKFPLPTQLKQFINKYFSDCKYFNKWMEEVSGWIYCEYNEIAFRPNAYHSNDAGSIHVTMYKDNKFYRGCDLSLIMVGDNIHYYEHNFQRGCKRTSPTICTADTVNYESFDPEKDGDVDNET